MLLKGDFAIKGAILLMGFAEPLRHTVTFSVPLTGSCLKDSTGCLKNMRIGQKRASVSSAVECSPHFPARYMDEENGRFG